MARPSIYSDALVDRICERLMAGESLRLICEDSDMPTTVTVYNWLNDPDKVEFFNKYARARDVQADMMVEDALNIADQVAGDPARDRLRVDTRKWIASKLKPKKYGDKLDTKVEHSGSVSIKWADG